jgi:hypothetical protein
MKHCQVGLKKVAVWRKMLPPQELERLEINVRNSGGEDERVERFQGGDLPVVQRWCRSLIGNALADLVPWSS